MVFNSYVFILCFLPIFIVGYFILNHFKLFKCGLMFITGMSLLFYGYSDIRCIPLLVLSIIANYFAYLGMRRIKGRKFRRIIVVATIIFDLCLLLYFKYGNFILSNLNRAAGTDFVLENIILPIGISFFTFQQIGFVIDEYRGEIKIKYDFLHYAAYMTFFPKLSQGPIAMHDDIIPQLMNAEKKFVNWNNVASGIYAFTLGLFKKMFFADSFGRAANWGFANINGLSSVSAFLVMLSFTLQIYFDFSGYCDMAMGIARMVNIDLPINFDSPYKSLTIRDFWRTWHITLNKFFTKYVYIPLGGSKKGKLYTYRNTLVVFALSGLWHGADWHFVVWGIGHGVMMIIYRQFKRAFDRLPSVFNWIITFSFVNIMWVFFRTEIADAFRLIGRAFGTNAGEVAPEILQSFWLEDYEMLIKWLQFPDLGQVYSLICLIMIFVIAGVIILGCKNTIIKMLHFNPNTYKSYASAVVCAFLLVWCLLNMSGISPFIYNNF